MNEFINNSQSMSICKDCPFYWVKVKKVIAETWTDAESREFCAKAQFELVCEHEEACKRAVRLNG